MDIQNTSTLTGEKLKIKFSSLKLTRPPDEFVIFDTRPKDFIVVSDDLTTANMDPCVRGCESCCCENIYFISNVRAS